MRKSLLQSYHELKEAHATTDFPKLLANTMHKALLSKFKGVNSPWREYTMKTSLSDFKKASRVVMSELADLTLKVEGGPNVGVEQKENGYDIQLKTFSSTLDVTRQTIINDDLRALLQTPERFGRAAARTIAKQIVAQIEGDNTAYDGSRLFLAAHSNSGFTALTNDATGIAALSAAMTAIETSTDPDSGEKMGFTPKYLLVAPDIEDAARRITDGANYIPVSTSGGTNVVGKVTRLTVLVEPFLNSTTAWYVLADPNDAPVIEVGFLDGQETPDLLIKKADTISAAGGAEDRWGYEFDDMHFKARYDFAVALAYYQGIYRGKA